MKRFATAIGASTVMASCLFAPHPVLADGRVAAGIAGGLIGGLLIGSAVAPRPYYYEPAAVYAVPPPPVGWGRGEPVWDEWRGVWYRPRIRVCD